MDHEELFITRNVKAVEDSSSSPSPYASLRLQFGCSGNLPVAPTLLFSGLYCGGEGGWLTGRNIHNYNIIMDIVFEWDADKAISNLKKHQVSFEEAQSVFQDPNALLIADPDHSIEEDRFILLGISKETKILVVCHCYRSNDEVIRIVSARKATKSESKQYERSVYER